MLLPVCFIAQQVLLKNGLFLKERFWFQGESRPPSFSEGKPNNFDKVTAPESVYRSLSLYIVLANGVDCIGLHFCWTLCHMVVLSSVFRT